MERKTPSAIVDRQMFPRQTKRTEIGSGEDDMLAIFQVLVNTVICDVVELLTTGSKALAYTVTAEKYLGWRGEPTT